jgi:hypothetical protein
MGRHSLEIGKAGVLGDEQLDGPRAHTLPALTDEQVTVQGRRHYPKRA